MQLRKSPRFPRPRSGPQHHQPLGLDVTSRGGSGDTQIAVLSWTQLSALSGDAFSALDATQVDRAKTQTHSQGPHRNSGGRGSTQRTSQSFDTTIRPSTQNANSTPSVPPIFDPRNTRSRPYPSQSRSLSHPISGSKHTQTEQSSNHSNRRAHDHAVGGPRPRRRRRVSDTQVDLSPRDPVAAALGYQLSAIDATGIAGLTTTQVKGVTARNWRRFRSPTSASLPRPK